MPYLDFATPLPRRCRTPHGAQSSGSGGACKLTCTFCQRGGPVTPRTAQRERHRSVELPWKARWRIHLGSPEGRCGDAATRSDRSGCANQELGGGPRLGGS